MGIIFFVHNCLFTSMGFVSFISLEMGVSSEPMIWKLVLEVQLTIEVRDYVSFKDECSQL